jgi:hypothetical protein
MAKPAGREHLIRKIQRQVEAGEDAETQLLSDEEMETLQRYLDEDGYDQDMHQGPQ